MSVRATPPVVGANGTVSPDAASIARRRQRVCATGHGMGARSVHRWPVARNRREDAGKQRWQADDLQPSLSRRVGVRGADVR